MTQRVSGPFRKATPSLFCLTEASRLDLASPAYSRPSRIPLWSPFTISSRNTFYYLTTRPGITASTLRLPCVLLPCLVTPASHVTLRSPVFSCILLHSPVSSCVSYGLVVSRTFCRFPGLEPVYSPPCVYLPSCSDHPLPIPRSDQSLHSPFHSVCSVPR